MKAELDRKEFADALKRVLPAATGRTALPVLRGVHLSAGGGTIRLTCSDIALTISSTVGASLKNVGKAEVVVPAELLSRVVSAMPGEEVDLSSKDDSLIVTSGETEVTLQTLDAASWPKQLENEGEGVDLNALQLGEVARILTFAASGKAAEATPLYSALHLIGSRVEITDGYRLGVLDFEGVDFEPVVIPASAVATVLRTDDAGCSVVIGERTVSFRTETATVTTAKTAAGEYPDLPKLLDTVRKPKTTLTFTCYPLREALQRIEMIDRHVTITPTGDFARLTASHMDVGAIEEVVPILEGDHVEPVRFGAAWLVDLIDAHGHDSITFGMADNGLRPVYVERPGFTGALMPTK